MRRPWSQHKQTTLFAIFFVCALAGMLLLTRIKEKESVINPFTLQAVSFLEGRFDIPIKTLLEKHNKNSVDFVQHKNKYYFPLPPAVSVLLIPFIFLFGITYAAPILHYLLIILAAYFAYLFFKRRGLDANTAKWLVYGLMFGSAFFGVCIFIGYVYVSHLLAVTLAFAALYEREGRDRPWVIGSLTALTCATRSTAGLAMILFFGVSELLIKNDWRQKIKRLTVFFLPIICVSSVLLWFNFARFGNVLDFGYKTSILTMHPEHENREKYGLFHPYYIGQNIWYNFLNPVRPYATGGWNVDPRGINFFIVGPIFLWLLALRGWTRDRLAAVITVAVTLVILLCYYCTGAVQYGTRYFCDFLPFLFLLLADVFKQQPLDRIVQLVLIGSAGINLFLANILRMKY